MPDLKDTGNLFDDYHALCISDNNFYILPKVNDATEKIQVIKVKLKCTSNTDPEKKILFAELNDDVIVDQAIMISAIAQIVKQAKQRYDDYQQSPATYNKTAYPKITIQDNPEITLVSNEEYKISLDEYDPSSSNFLSMLDIGRIEFKNNTSKIYIEQEVAPFKWNRSAVNNKNKLECWFLSKLRPNFMQEKNPEYAYAQDIEYIFAHCDTRFYIHNKDFSAQAIYGMTYLYKQPFLTVIKMFYDKLKEDLKSSNNKIDKIILPLKFICEVCCRVAKKIFSEIKNITHLSISIDFIPNCLSMNILRNHKDYKIDKPLVQEIENLLSQNTRQIFDCKDENDRNQLLDYTRNSIKQAIDKSILKNSLVFTNCESKGILNSKEEHISIIDIDKQDITDIKIQKECADPFDVEKTL